MPIPDLAARDVLLQPFRASGYQLQVAPLVPRPEIGTVEVRVNPQAALISDWHRPLVRVTDHDERAIHIKIFLGQMVLGQEQLAETVKLRLDKRVPDTN